MGKVTRILACALGLVSLARSDAPSGTTVCDYYSAHYNPANTTDAQMQWIQAFVVNVFGGNSTVFTGTSVAGILTPGTFNGASVKLVKYFDGTLYATDGANGQPGAVNWLDDGGIVALATGNYSNTRTSNQFKLFSHFGSLFARVMQCSTIGSANFTSALQKTSLYQIHKYMALNPDELGYFIQQVGLAAQLGGLSTTEATTITTNMGNGLTYRCKAPAPLFPGGVVGPQTICTDASCPISPNADCSAYDVNNGTSPSPALVNGQAAPSVSLSPTNSSTPTNTPAAASSDSHKKTVDIAVGVAVPVGVIALALVAFLFWRQKRKMHEMETRISRVEGGTTPSHTLGSDTQSHIGEYPPGMASLNWATRQSQAGSQIAPYHPSGLTMDEQRMSSGEHYKPPDVESSPQHTGQAFSGTSPGQTGPTGQTFAQTSPTGQQYNRTSPRPVNAGFPQEMEGSHIPEIANYSPQGAPHVPHMPQ
ncbi:hypothetical protein BT63DRAFT_380420 [Microthyrium microscopicum]|uniref:Uncharacterized protein n=1 Tax=Microthyrium microscopicum TaxID=703497 RepID=A0A6A6TST8_9PEZI|nr:hypothetical protein BT63DRAFT_380420 [Microthyrium microscopicum]